MEKFIQIIPENFDIDMQNSCKRCARPVNTQEPLVALRDGKTVYHKACFACDLCYGPLTPQFASKNGKIFHTECYTKAKAQAPRCAKCIGPILPTDVAVAMALGGATSPNGKDVTLRFHSRCFMCDACKKPLNDRFFTYGQTFIHETCVSCSVCGQNVYRKPFSQLQEGGYICDPCLNQSLILYQQHKSYQDQQMQQALLQEIQNKIVQGKPEVTLVEDIQAESPNQQVPQNYNGLGQNPQHIQMNGMNQPQYNVNPPNIQIPYHQMHLPQQQYTPRQAPQSPAPYNQQHVMKHNSSSASFSVDEALFKGDASVPQSPAPMTPQDQMRMKMQEQMRVEQAKNWKQVTPTDTNYEELVQRLLNIQGTQQ